MNLRVKSFDEFEAYKEAFLLSTEIFQISKTFPREERYALTDQIRRASRSIGANLAESWAKRKYPAQFLSELTDADGELQETKHWLAIVEKCQYSDPARLKELQKHVDQVGRLLGGMIRDSESFCVKQCMEDG